MDTPTTYEEAVARKAEMIADVGFWFTSQGLDRPDDAAIWQAWGDVLRERGNANSLDVAGHLANAR